MKDFATHLRSPAMVCPTNTLKNIRYLGTRLVILQRLAWMWYIIFSMSLGLILLFGLTAVAHAFVTAGVFATVATSDEARNKPGNLLLN